MPHLLTAGLLFLAAAYLIGSIPFGYLIGHVRGVDLFREGSGNIGATNVGRVLGRKTGVLVFVLDFLKGALPVALIMGIPGPTVSDALGLPHALSVGAAVATFLGHLYPITLGFRGGKGVATGAGTVAVLVPGPFVAALAAWVLIVLVTRTVSLASLVAVGVLVAVRLAVTPAPFDSQNIAITAFCCLGSLLVVVKHRANLRRLLAGTESRIGDSSMRHTFLRVAHVLAVGLWFGGAGFFNFAAAPSIFRSFSELVSKAPEDRTPKMLILPANGDLLKNGKDPEKMLANALAGTAVGPIFPMYFAMQTVCGLVAVGTAWVWRRADNGRPVHKTRLFVTTIGLLTVLAGWPLSSAVSNLRPLRFDPDPTVASSADQSFTTLHFISLGLSVVTVSLAGVALVLAAKLPREEFPDIVTE